MCAFWFFGWRVLSRHDGLKNDVPASGAGRLACLSLMLCWRGPCVRASSCLSPSTRCACLALLFDSCAGLQSPVCGPVRGAQQVRELANTGTGTLDWSLIFVDGEGHSVQPSYGLLSTTKGLIKEGQLVQVTLTTSTYGLVPGTYTTRLQLSTNGACIFRASSVHLLLQKAPVCG